MLKIRRGDYIERIGLNTYFQYALEEFYLTALDAHYEELDNSAMESVMTASLEFSKPIQK